MIVALNFLDLKICHSHFGRRIIHCIRYCTSLGNKKSTAIAVVAVKYHSLLSSLSSMAHFAFAGSSAWRFSLEQSHDLSALLVSKLVPSDGRFQMLSTPNSQLIPSWSLMCKYDDTPPILVKTLWTFKSSSLNLPSLYGQNSRSGLKG